MSKKPGTKTEKKQQEKVIQDKTFGLKNKNKSVVVQKYCKGVAHQVTAAGQSAQKLEEQEFEEKKQKKKAQQEAELLANLYKTVGQIKDGNDTQVDPGEIVCAYFKQGLCQKGKKCKFSHDLSKERHSDQVDLYMDQRAQLQQNEDRAMERMTKEELEKLISEKEVQYHSQKPTAIVCNFFLNAVEKNTYGWKWVCPNGMGCHYRHCLPPGYMLKRNTVDGSKPEEAALEDEIMDSLSKIEGKTRLTLEIFLEWKKRKIESRAQQVKAKEEKEQKATGKNKALSGRALFVYNPELFNDDENAAQVDYRQREEADTEDEDEGNEYQDIDEEDNENEDDDQEEQIEESTEQSEMQAGAIIETSKAYKIPDTTETENKDQNMNQLEEQKISNEQISSAQDNILHDEQTINDQKDQADINVDSRILQNLEDNILDEKTEQGDSQQG